MNKSIVIALAALLSACATDSSERRPAATRETEPETRQARSLERHTEADVRPVRPVAPAALATPVGPQAEDRRAATDDAPTPMHQGNGDADLEYTRKIRKALLDDDNLSTSAKNVQVVSDQGQVSLRGKVKNEAERRAVTKYAKQVVGSERVHDELEIAP